MVLVVKAGLGFLRGLDRNELREFLNKITRKFWFWVWVLATSWACGGSGSTIFRHYPVEFSLHLSFASGTLVPFQTIKVQSQGRNVGITAE